MQRNIYILFVFLSLNVVFSQNSNAFDVARKGSLADFKLLFEKDKNIINAIDEKGTSMLILACYRGNQEVAKFLIDNGADLNHISSNGTALMACVYKNESDLVDKILQKKANINLTDANGVTALMLAVQINNIEMVKRLLDAKASKDLKCNQNKTAFEYAVFSNHSAIINLLK